MEDRKIPFFKRLKLAIFNIERYQDFALEKTSVSFKYFAKLILFFCIIICFAISYEYITMAKTGIQLIKDDIPDFSFENNILEAKSDEATIIEKNDMNINYSIIVDTNVDEESNLVEEYTKRVESYDIGFVFLKDKILIKTGLSDQAQSIPYETITSQYGIGKFDKEALVQYLDNIDFISGYIALYLTLLIYLFCTYFIATLLETVLLFVLGFFTTRVFRVNLLRKQIYSLALYALTLPILLNAIYIPINILTGFEIKYFQIMYTTVSYIYLITAILLIRSELIKQQADLKQIEKVQEEVKQEIEEREKEDKKEEKDKDSGTNEQEPEGSM